MRKNLFPTSGGLSASEVCTRIFTEALNEVDPVKLVETNLSLNGNLLKIMDKKFLLNDFNSIHVLGVGKCASYLAEGLSEILGNIIDGGLIISNPGIDFMHDSIELIAGSHPLPDEKSVAAGKAMLRYVSENVKKNDLVFFLITGGASSLMELPGFPFSITDVNHISNRLMRAGADIRELNCVRKKMSKIKGGQLAYEIHPAAIINLLVSDIVGSPLQDIGSGPTIPDSLGNCDAGLILKKYGLFETLSAKFKTIFSPTTNSKPRGSKDKNRINTFLLGDNKIALQKAKKVAEKMKINAKIMTSEDQGNAVAAASKYAEEIQGIARQVKNFAPPIILLSGGEFTVDVTGNGKGGRNQEFLLALLIELKKMKTPFHVVSLGTDGKDGQTDAAGAWINNKTHKKAEELGLNPSSYLRNNDSYHFFKKLNQLVITGPTRTNVMDLRLFYIGRS